MSFDFLPICKLCGSRHRLGQCENSYATSFEDYHAFDPREELREAPEALHAPGKQETGEVADAAKTLGTFSDEELKAELQRRKPSRREYMRDYMRRRRHAHSASQ